MFNLDYYTVEIFQNSEESKYLQLVEVQDEDGKYRFDVVTSHI